MEKSHIVLLDAGSASMRALGRRLRSLDCAVLGSKTPDHAERLLGARRERIGAVVMPVDLPTFDLGTALRFLRRLEPSGELTFLATGRRPDDEGRRLLRQAGVELALWEPVDDHALRFQVNRALANSSIVRGDRSNLRAPTDWPVPIWSGQRRKSARAYSLSATGAFLATWRPSLPNAELRVGFPIPTGPVRLHARVVMTNVPGNLMRPNLPVGMGVRFEGASREVQDCLLAWVQQRLEALGF